MSMKLRFGLQARFLVAMAVTLAVVFALLALLLQRQSAMQREVDVLGREAMHKLTGHHKERETLATDPPRAPEAGA